MLSASLIQLHSLTYFFFNLNFNVIVGIKKADVRPDIIKGF